MPVRVYTANGMKYRYVGADGKPYYTDQPEEDPIYIGRKLIVRMDKLRKANPSGPAPDRPPDPVRGGSARNAA